MQTSTTHAAPHAVTVPALQNHENLCGRCGWAKVNHAEFAVQCGAPIHEEACSIFIPRSQERVNHPKHYNSHPSGIECIVVIEHMTLCAGSAVKYLWRAGLKTLGDTTPREARLEDLKKALWYVKREIERLEKEGK